MSTAEKQIYRFEFRGTASEYFRIWIVNVMLTIVTLGVYSAWAKVRTRRYFYGNTSLNGASFDYHANPIDILKGRLILGIFGLCYFGANFFPPLIFVVLVLVPFIPWLMVRGMMYNLRNTSYRGIRFGFEKAYKDSYKTFGKAFLAGILTLGVGFLWTPFFWRRFFNSHSRFGNQQFTFNGKARDFGRCYNVWILCIFLALLGVFGMAFAIGLLFGKEQAKLVGMIVPVISVIFFYAAAGMGLASYKARSGNFFIRHTRLGEVDLDARYDGFDLFLIYVQNFFACLLTLGLAWPWAVVELAKYRAQYTAVRATPDAFENMVQHASTGEVGALGDEIADVWDIDMGF